jgi:hypothetical protein
MRADRPGPAPANVFSGFRVLAAFSSVVLLFGAAAGAQTLSDLEPDRPLLMEDARPVSYRAFSGSVDWTYDNRNGGLDDYGPGFSLLYGAARGLEVGAAIRWVTRPERNAERGVASGDLMLHTLYQVLDETATRPAVAIRAELQFPTGLDSKGTDLHLALLGTRSFDAFRLNANFRYVRLGATNTFERRDRFEGIAGMDFVVSGQRGLTDTLLLADISVRSNPVIGGSPLLTLESGVRRRIGSQTILFAGVGSEFSGTHDRNGLRLRIGLTHTY